MLKPKRIDAIVSLSPKTGFSSDNDGNVIEWDISLTKSGLSQPTEKAIQTKLDSMISDWDANQYQRDRQYPQLGEQLDMLFHDMTAGKGTKSGEWYKAIKKVKADNPKG